MEVDAAHRLPKVLFDPALISQNWGWGVHREATGFAAYQQSSPQVIAKYRLYVLPFFNRLLPSFKSTAILPFAFKSKTVQFAVFGQVRKEVFF